VFNLEALKREGRGGRSQGEESLGGRSVLS